MKTLAIALIMTAATPALAKPVTTAEYKCALYHHNQDDSYTKLGSYTGVLDWEKVLFTDNGLDYKAYNNGDETTLELEILQAGTMHSVQAVVAENSTYLSTIVIGSQQGDFKDFSCSKVK